MSNMFRFFLGRILTIHTVVTLLAFLIVKIGVITTVHSTALTANKPVVIATTHLASENELQVYKSAAVSPAHIAAQISVINVFNNWSLLFGRQPTQVVKDSPAAKVH